MKWISLICCVVLLSGSHPVTPPKIVFFGDSITAGWPIWRYTHDVLRAGVSGQTSAQMLARFRSDVLERHPTMVVILAGTNDIVRLHNPSITSIKAMASAAAHAGIRVILAKIPPNMRWLSSYAYTDPAKGLAAIRGWNEAIAATAAANGYRVVDFYTTMVLPDGSQNKAFFKDGIHPTRAGYDAMWAAVEPLIEPRHELTTMR